LPIARYFVERLTAHSDDWVIRLDEEECGPYKSQSEAVRFALDAAEKLSEHGEKAQVVIIGPTWTHDQDISRGSW
jgi:Arc/MetJ-type ribon-helix-helix transcriptional regulator